MQSSGGVSAKAGGVHIVVTFGYRQLCLYWVSMRANHSGLLLSYSGLA